MGSRALALLAVLCSCTGELRELGVDLARAPDGGAPPRDLAGAPADLAGTPDAATRATFAPTIQNDLDALGCAAANCHDGTAPMKLIPKATLAADLQANYDQVKFYAASGAQSALLRRNLATSGVSHPGGHPFLNTSDPTYQRWLGWINDGAPSGL